MYIPIIYVTAHGAYMYAIMCKYLFSAEAQEFFRYI